MMALASSASPGSRPLMLHLHSTPAAASSSPSSSSSSSTSYNAHVRFVCWGRWATHLLHHGRRNGLKMIVAAAQAANPRTHVGSSKATAKKSRTKKSSPPSSATTIPHSNTAQLNPINEPQSTNIKSKRNDGDDGEGDDNDDDNSGNPLGKRALGKQVVKWIGDGMSAMAAALAKSEIADDEEDGNIAMCEFEGGQSFVMQAQHYLNITPMPPGFECVCLRASTHYPTLFDHFQRELQKALVDLESKGAIQDWKQTKAWKLLKSQAKSGSHRVIARKAPKMKQLHEELGLARERLAEIQVSIDEFVGKTIQLLQIERKSELEATQLELDASASTQFDANGQDSNTNMPSVKAGPTEYLVNHGGLEQEQCDTICNLVAVSSSTGLGGTHLITLRAEQGHRLPPTNISPGDMIWIRICDAKGTAHRTKGCIKGFVHSLGEDGSSISAAVEARYGDPVFSKLFGRRLRIDRIPALADPITYERNVEALQLLQKLGLHKKNPAAAVVATLFGDGPDICWLAHHGSLNNDNTTVTTTLSPDAVSSSSLKSQKLESDDELDESQRKAIELGLNKHRPLVLIQGPPGTGKSTVICKLIMEAVSRGERVLVTAPTNAAVDNLVERLAMAVQAVDVGDNDPVNVVRIGNPFRVAPAVSSRSLSAIVETKMADFQKEFARRRADLRSDLRQCLGDDSLAVGIRQLLKQLSRSLKQKEKEVIDETLSNAHVVLSTNTGAGEALVQNLPAFDLVLIDEAAQAVEPACWIPLLRGKRAVLAGDPCQLAPVILSRDALDGGLGVSLLERACGLHGGSLRTLLKVQYRMNDAIASWSSKEMYGGELHSSPVVASHLLADGSGVKVSWVTKIPLLLLDTRLPFGSLTPRCEECLDPAGTGSFYNEGEANIAINHVKALINAGVAPSSIVIQSPYIAQVQLLRERIEEDLPTVTGVQIASVDSFQGREADAVIISMVRSNSVGAVGFLGDRRRINVAVTRARKHIAIVCDSSTVSNNKFLARFLQHIRRNGEVRHAGSDAAAGHYHSMAPTNANAAAAVAANDDDDDDDDADDAGSVSIARNKLIQQSRT